MQNLHLCLDGGLPSMNYMIVPIILVVHTLSESSVSLRFASQSTSGIVGNISRVASTYMKIGILIDKM